MATRVGHDTICLTSFNSPTPKPPTSRKDLGDICYISWVIADFFTFRCHGNRGQSSDWHHSIAWPPNPPVRCKYLPFISYASRVITILAKISLPWQCGSVEVEYFLTSVNSRPRKPSVFSSLSDHAPPYLTDDIHLVSEGHRRRLRSSTDRSCAVPRTHNTFGDRSFAVAGPRVGTVFRPTCATRTLYIQQFQAWTQSVFVLMLLPGRNETFVNCAI